MPNLCSEPCAQDRAPGGSDTVSSSSPLKPHPLRSRPPCFCPGQFHWDLPPHRRGAGYRADPGCHPAVSHSCTAAVCSHAALPRASVRPLLRARPLGSEGGGQGSPPGAEKRPLRGLLPLPHHVRQATAPSHSTFWMSLHPKCSGSLLHLRPPVQTQDNGSARPDLEAARSRTVHR